MTYETRGKSNDYYSPAYIFDALGVRFDMDVACPEDRTYIHVPADHFISSDSLSKEWKGFIWMNPPFEHENQKFQWINKFVAHGNGIALYPDRTSAGWWPYFTKRCDAILFVYEKIKFIRPDGSIAQQPGTGTTLFAIGEKAVNALKNAEANGLGMFFTGWAQYQGGGEQPLPTTGTTKQ